MINSTVQEVFYFDQEISNLKHSAEWASTAEDVDQPPETGRLRTPPHGCSNTAARSSADVTLAGPRRQEVAPVFSKRTERAVEKPRKQKTCVISLCTGAFPHVRSFVHCRCEGLWFRPISWDSRLRRRGKRQ